MVSYNSTPSLPLSWIIGGSDGSTQSSPGRVPLRFTLAKIRSPAREGNSTVIRHCPVGRGCLKGRRGVKILRSLHSLRMTVFWYNYKIAPTDLFLIQDLIVLSYLELILPEILTQNNYSDYLQVYSYQVQTCP